MAATGNVIVGIMPMLIVRDGEGQEDGYMSWVPRFYDPLHYE
jgi:hypothetical protein